MSVMKADCWACPTPFVLNTCKHAWAECRYISEDFNGSALHPVDLLDAGSGRILTQLVDANLVRACCVPAEIARECMKPCRSCVRMQLASTRDVPAVWDRELCSVLV